MRILWCVLLLALTARTAHGQTFGDIKSDNTSIAYDAENDLFEFAALKVDSERADALKITLSDGTVILGVDASAPAITLGASTLPRADATYNLGSDGVRWANVYAGSLTLSSDLTLEAFAAGGVLFAEAGGAVSQDSAHLFWDNSGKRLGLGAASPASPLHVYQDSGNTDAACGVTIEQAGAGDAYLQLLQSGAARWIVGVDHSAGDRFGIGTGDEDLGECEGLWITTGGNVAINTTDIEAWQSGYTGCQLGGNFALLATTAVGPGGASFLLQNAYADGAWKYRSTDEASYLKQQDGIITLAGAASGAADQALTWTEYAHLSPAGAVFNDGSTDRDFRVESASLTHALYVDGALEAVGVNVADPDAQMEIATRNAGEQVLHLKAAGGQTADILWASDSSDTVLAKITAGGSYQSNLGTSVGGVNHISLTTAETLRWSWGLVDVEAGANAGSNFSLWSYSDAGAYVATAMKAVRDSGNVIFPNNVSVGTTDVEAWNSSFRAIQLGGNASLMGTTATGAGGYFFLAQNAYYDGAWKYRSTDEASDYYQLSGEHIFNTAVSGASDNAVSWLELLSMGPSEVVFNDASADRDFRVESDGSAHALFVDGGTNVVSLGSSDTETWTSTYAVLQMGGNAALLGEKVTAAGTRLQMIHNLYYDGGWKYKSTDEAELISMVSGATTFYTALSGTADTTAPLIEQLFMSAYNTTFNEASNDIDFRIESDGQPYMFFLDAGANIIGIGASAVKGWPAGYTPLQIGGNQQIVASTGQAAGSALYICNNAYYDGAWKYISTDEASRLTIGGGVYGFASAASGTAGTTPTFYDAAHFGLAENVFNDSSQDIDFRVESDGNGSCLFVDGAADTVSVGGAFSLAAQTELTIATGAITVTKSYHSVDTQADAASDELDTISGAAEGDTLILRANDSARTVVAKDGTGNLQLNGDMTLDNSQDTLTLIFDGANWLEISRSNNGA